MTAHTSFSHLYIKLQTQAILGCIIQRRCNKKTPASLTVNEDFRLLLNGLKPHKIPRVLKERSHEASAYLSQAFNVIVPLLHTHDCSF